MNNTSNSVRQDNILHDVCKYFHLDRTLDFAKRRHINYIKLYKIYEHERLLVATTYSTQRA